MEPRTTPAPEGQSTLLPPNAPTGPAATDAANIAGQEGAATATTPTSERPSEPEAVKPSSREAVREVVARISRDAAKPAKAPRARRGPPADGVEEERVVAIMTTSKLQGVDGMRLRRGSAVSVPVRRLDGLIRSGKVRTGSPGAIEAARRRHGEGRIG